MIVGVTFSEGGLRFALDINPLMLPEIMKTGEVTCPNYKNMDGLVNYTNCPPRKIAALFLGDNLIYDFVLKDLGQCPMCFRYYGKNNDK